MGWQPGDQIIAARFQFSYFIHQLIDAYVRLAHIG
jgi:hypothetical protein